MELFVNTDLPDDSGKMSEWRLGRSVHGVSWLHDHFTQARTSTCIQNQSVFLVCAWIADTDLVIFENNNIKISNVRGYSTKTLIWKNICNKYNNTIY